MIGEDGPGNPEFVIPTRTKRWDLLYQAMRAYGIPGYAEGTATGGTGTGGAATDAEEMKAYFGIKGLASMSSQVQRIISDLKDFFRISWTIIKSEGAVAWKGIETTIVNEATVTRDSAWQSALDIRNTWLSANAAILADTTTSYAAMWPGISPSILSIHDGIITSFSDSKSQVTGILDQTHMEAITSLQSFKSDWDGVWSQMLADLQSTAAQITSILEGIGASLSNISVNASVNIGSFGGGGGSGYSTGSVSMSGAGNAGSGNNFQDCLFGEFEDTCTGVLVNALTYTNPAGQTYQINPLTYLDNGGISSYQGSSAGQVIAPGYSSASSYQLPAIFRAKGALIDDGPELDIVGEAGPEMILPPNLTRMFLDLANAGLGANAPANSGRIIIEDHSKIDLYMDGKKVTDILMTNAAKKMRLRGGIPTQ